MFETERLSEEENSIWNSIFERAEEAPTVEAETSDDDFNIFGFQVPKQFRKLLQTWGTNLLNYLLRDVE
jgi:hypothetical protein